MRCGLLALALAACTHHGNLAPDAAPSDAAASDGDGSAGLWAAGVCETWSNGEWASVASSVTRSP